MNLYMNHVSAEMIQKNVWKILTASQADIRALASVVEALLQGGYALCDRRRR